MDSKDSSPSFEKKRKLSYDSLFQDRIKTPRVLQVSTEQTDLENHNSERRTDKSDDPEHGLLSPPYTNSIVSTGSSADERVEPETKLTYKDADRTVSGETRQHENKTGGLESVASNMDRVAYEPSEDERASYYFGLPSAPRLIARTSGTAWAQPQGGDWGPRTLPPKQFRAIGNHEILVRWSEEVKTSLIRALDGHDWRCFYPIRLGYTDDLEYGERTSDGPAEHYPVVLLVAIAESELEWEHAIELALACRAILREADINDVEVELLESDVTALGCSRADLERLVVDDYWDSSNLMSAVATKINEALLPVLPYLGYHIVQAPSGKGGTMCVHLRLGSGRSQTYGLVSRHVAVADKLEDAADYRYVDSTYEIQNVVRINILFPLSAVEAALDSLAQARSSISEHCGRSNLELKVKEYRATDMDLAKLRDQDSLLEYLDMLTPRLKALLGVTPEEVSIEGRKLGHVAFSPKHEVHNRHGFFRDWALVELDEAQFQHAPENKVFIGNENRLAIPFASRPVLDSQAFLRVRGIRPLQTRKRESYYVGKYGRTTGLTFGIVGEIEAIIRRPLSGEGEIISWALLIISAGRKKYPGDPFSEPGDSGSCIFDMSGRLVGMLDAGQQSSKVRRCGKAYTEPEPQLPPTGTSGTAAPEGYTDFDESYGAPRRETEARQVDVTFATPMDWLLQDVEDFTGLKAEIL